MYFISYSWQDRAVAHGLQAVLRAKRLSCWIDVDCMDLRLPLQPQIVDAVGRSMALLLIDTAASRHSPWVQFERAAAERAGVPVLTVTNRQ